MRNTILAPATSINGAQSQVFNYGDTAVTFQNADGVVMVNATQMAKPFGVRCKDWLRLPATKRFLKVLAESKGIAPDNIKQDISNNPIGWDFPTLSNAPIGGENLPLSETPLILVRQNGKGVKGYTLLHEDLAIEFARWLAPAFGVWCNDRIKELMRYGITATPQTIDSIIEDPDNAIRLLTALKEERAERQRLADTLEQKSLQIEQMTPKAEFFDEVLQSESSFSITQIAKGFGMSGTSLNKLLHAKGVQYRSGKSWVLYDKYQDKGYTKPRTIKYKDKEGKQYTQICTFWTEAGRKFIFDLLKSEGVFTQTRAEF